MQINIKMTSMEITESISEKLNKSTAHIEKILHEKAEDSALLTVEIGKKTKHHRQGDIFFTQLHLVRDGDDFNVMSEKEELLDSIDAAEEELLRQIKSKQDKRKDLTRQGGKEIKDASREE
ncbi:MAG TPA: HPF/RaiA family ribosome-associated protein [Candidatus Paceibacterota bacterium]|nr:HPF/RaiA family ribosome-associated protein [Candidatus Paceibacterota bacterium]